jgi:uncharacterized protein (DUF2344 family)
MRSSIHIIDAWRIAHEPQAITEAITIGQQINDLLNQASTQIDQACYEVNPVIERAHYHCRLILNQLTSEVHRLAPVLTRLQVINRAVAPE